MNARRKGFVRKPLTIMVIRSAVNGKWSYCAEAAVRLLQLELAEDAPYATAEEAAAAARADRSVPAGSVIQVVG